MIDFLASVDPMTLPLWAVVLFAASMYPMGFLFGVCSECCEQCSNETCDGFDLEEAYQPDGSGSPSGRCLHYAGGGGPFGPASEYASIGRDLGSLYGGFEYCDNDYPAVPEGCAGTPAQVWQRRRSCVRWVCRCYESTGKRGQIDESTGLPFGPADWFRVTSTTVVGGPTTSDLDLGAELDSAEFDNGNPETYQESVIYDIGGFTDGPDGTKGCIVFAFVFYGWITDCGPYHIGSPNLHIPRDDCYTIHACTRCV